MGCPPGGRGGPGGTRLGAEALVTRTAVPAPRGRAAWSKGVPGTSRCIPALLPPSPDPREAWACAGQTTQGRDLNGSVCWSSRRTAGTGHLSPATAPRALSIRHAPWGPELTDSRGREALALCLQLSPWAEGVMPPQTFPPCRQPPVSVLWPLWALSQHLWWFVLGRREVRGQGIMGWPHLGNSRPPPPRPPSLCSAPASR